MATDQTAGMPIATTTSIQQNIQSLLARGKSIGVILGPLVGLLIWVLPFGIEPVAHKALAILAFIIISWIVGAVEYGLTALCGCFLFWALRATPFDVAFSGFAQPTPWFVFAALLIAQAVDCCSASSR
jgi:di/tricarboxylate transporter